MNSNYHLGINLGHDRSVSIIKDGEIKVAIEQERLDRIKHSIGFMHQSPGKASHIQIPHESIKYCLDYLDITLDDVDTITGNMPGNDHSFDILKNNFSKKYAHKIKKVPSHHLAHAYSAYWPSGFDRAIVLIADGSGSTFNEGGVQKTESYSLYKAEGERLTLIHSELVTSHLADIGTLGFVYEYITRQAGFISKVGGLKIPEAGKLMGLAPFGSDQPNLNKWIKCNEGSYHLSISPYDILLEFESLKKLYDSGENKLYLKPLIVDLAFKVQKELEEALIHLSKLAKEETGFNNICLAGGVALNSVANYKIYKEVGFENMFIFPAAGDNGISAGCALWSYHQSGGSLRQPLKKATLGKNYAKVLVLEALSKFEDQVDFHEKTSDEIISFSAEALSKGHILCRFEGGSEYGPRALGHRSIVADPSFEKMKDIVNGRVKFREGFRPFAPFIPKENLSDVFDINIEVPFMLVVPTIKEKFQKILPSITHVDGTGRVQSVTKEENNYFYNLCHKVTEFRGGPPVLLNTSFNVAGQPIVETPEEAIETFLKTDIDYIVIDNFWISKKNSKVLDYSEHLDKIYHSPVPKGLSKIIPNVKNEMELLDKALFNEGENNLWGEEELIKISEKGGKFKETSSLFPVSFKSQLSPNTVFILDPLGKNQIFDLNQKLKEKSYTFLEAKMILLLIEEDQVELENIRLKMRLNTLQFETKISQIKEDLKSFGVVLNFSYKRFQEDKKPSDHLLTFGDFEDESFSLRNQLSGLNKILKKYNYSEKSICSLLNLESLQQIEPTKMHYYAEFILGEDTLSILIKLFLLRSKIPEFLLKELFGEKLFKTLMDIGLLLKHDNKITSRIDLFAVEDLFIATDHRYMFLSEDKISEDPVMYLGMDSHGLVQTVPRKTSDETLDLCCGSGIQGLIASSYSKNVTSVDINPRAIRFSRFNAQLNGIDNIKFQLGNLYEDLKGMTFDLILANPPFVPSPNSNYKFRDGGSNGEEILREIVIQSRNHLKEFGRLCIVTDLVEVKAYKTKLVSWLDGASYQSLVLHTADRDEILFSVPHSHAPFGQSYEDYVNELNSWLVNFRNSKLENVNFGYILVEMTNDDEQNAYDKIINNPSKPIFNQVEKFFRDCTLIKSKKYEDYFLTTAPGLSLRQDYDLNKKVYSFKAEVPGNSYFTEYSIKESLYKSLKEISQKNPKFKDFIKNQNEKVFKDLILKGIVQLSKIKNKPFLIEESQEESLFISEVETKTTPTCLSSYLK